MLYIRRARYYDARYCKCARARARMHVSHAIRMLRTWFKVPSSATCHVLSSAPTPGPARCMRAPENPAPRPSPACAWFPATPGGILPGATILSKGSSWNIIPHVSRASVMGAACMPEA